MMITRFDPFREIAEMRERMEYFNKLINGAEGRMEEKGVDFIPSVNT